jgi:hypothetical protein
MILLAILIFVAAFCCAVLLGAYIWMRRLAARLKLEAPSQLELKRAEIQRRDAATAQPCAPSDTTAAKKH